MFEIWLRDEESHSESNDKVGLGEESEDSESDSDGVLLSSNTLSNLASNES